jgi:basic membrane protein A
VHSLLFRQREAAFLAGHLAARVVASEVRGSSATAAAGPITLGAVGGLPIPVVDDFIDGFAAGATHAEPQLRLLRQYANSFSDPATAKDIAKAMYAQGAGLVFQVAGGSGQGVIEAAAETGRWAIGVDSDQYALYREAYPARAAHILSSVLKNVDAGLLQALGQLKQGTLQFGVTSSLGLAEGGVSLAHSGPGWQALPPAFAAEMAALAQAVASGSQPLQAPTTVVHSQGVQR